MHARRPILTPEKEASGREAPSAIAPGYLQKNRVRGPNRRRDLQRLLDKGRLGEKASGQGPGLHAKRHAARR